MGLKVASSVDFHEIMHTSDTVSVRTAVGKEIGTYFIFRARHKRLYFLELHFCKSNQKSVSIFSRTKVLPYTDTQLGGYMSLVDLS